MNLGKMYLFLKMAYASAKSIKEQGYPLVMYTDKLGAEILSGFPYDEIVVLDIPEPVNPRMFAAIKYFALDKEPLGTIHVDYDIMLDKPCIKPKEGWDLITQMKYTCKEFYLPQRKILDEYGFPEAMTKIKLSPYPYCVGVIGFNNEELKQKFLDNYFDAVEMYSDKKINLTIDLLFEQTFISSLVDEFGYNADFVTEEKAVYYGHPVSDKGIRYFNDYNKGFKHFHAQSKWTMPVLNEITKRLKKEEIALIDRNYLIFIRNKNK